MRGVSVVSLEELFSRLWCPFVCIKPTRAVEAFCVFTGVFNLGFTGEVVFFAGGMGVRQAGRMAFLGYLK